MIYVNLFDQVIKDEVIKKHEKAVILSSVNTGTDALNTNSKINQWISFHRLIRFDQFKCFHESLTHVANKADEIYLKYGGFCFLDDYKAKNRFEYVKDHFSFLLENYKDKIVIDPFSNKLFWETGPSIRIFDKMIIKCILETGNTDLIYYRPKVDAMPTLDISTIHNLTEKDITSNELTSKIIF